MADQAIFQATNQSVRTQIASSNTGSDATIADQSNRVRIDAGQSVELLPIDKLVPYSRNARTHSRHQIRQLGASIRRYGFTAPVLIDEHNQILAGHARVQAAKLIGLAAVPTLRLSNLSAAEKRGYIIADNRLAQKARWDREILAIEFQALVDLNFDVELTGFDAGEIGIVSADADEGRHKQAPPEHRTPQSLPEQVVSRPGDLWLLGSHRLLCNGGDHAADAVLLDVDVMVQCWQSYTGKPAKLDATGQTFDEVAVQRTPAWRASATGPKHI